MSLAAITITLTVTFGGGQIGQVYLDLNPVIAVHIGSSQPFGTLAPNSYASGFAGTTIGNVILVNDPVLDAAVRRDPGYRVDFWREEVEHSKQWSALGPLFPVLYAISRGQPFEPYPSRNLGGYTADQYDFALMWQPTQQESGRCPAIRIGLRNRGSAIFPCWRF